MASHEIAFQLVHTEWDYNRHGDSSATHTIQALAAPQKVGERAVEIEGTLTVRGLDLKPGQIIAAVLTII